MARVASELIGVTKRNVTTTRCACRHRTFTVGASNHSDATQRRNAPRSQAHKVLSTLQQFDTEPNKLLKEDLNIDSFDDTVHACAQTAHWQAALWLFAVAMPRHGIAPGVVSLAIALNACANGRAVARGLQLLADAREEHIAPNVVVYNTAIHACSQVGLWDEALRLLETMDVSSVEVNVITLTAAVCACKRGGQWRHAVQVLSRMLSLGSSLQPDAVAFGAAISACEKGRRWELALQLLRRMDIAYVTPDTSCMSAAVSACASGGRWEQALWLIGDTRGISEDVGIIAWNAALGACERSRAWARSLDVLAASRQRAMRPGVEALRSVIAACEVVAADATSNVAELSLFELRRCLIKKVFTRGVGEYLRGECVAVASQLHGRGLLNNTVGKRLWRYVLGLTVDQLHRATRRSSALQKQIQCNDGQESDDEATRPAAAWRHFNQRVNDMNDPSLQGLFEVGGVCARAALQAWGHDDLIGGGMAIAVTQPWDGGNVSRRNRGDRNFGSNSGTDIGEDGGLATANLGDAECWRSIARQDLQRQLRPSLWSARESAARAQLAVWCSDRVIMVGFGIDSADGVTTVRTAEIV
eukprot:TRINITY_DN38467_c0_g1_i1.p1 TRINITY_DN38467_c0_g1~~TRINITY_DN38467_c0_g1_i1.p1  ORF type:complete len:587 (-),score=80.51 TRINITY_DN38467_c0_g1_i1:54-1814(-)